MKDNSIFNPVEQYISKLQDKYDIPTAFYPSSASCEVDGKIIGGWDCCLRAQYYKWKGIKPTNKIVYRSWLATRLGTAYEEAFLDAYEEEGLLKGRDIPFFVEVMGIPISGRVDGLTKKNELIECCHPDSLIVKGDYSISKIKEIKKNDKVIVSTGEKKKVQKIFKRNTEGFLYRLRGKFDGLFSAFTSEHPILIAKVKINRCKSFPRIYSIVSTEYKEIQNLKKGDYICIPKANFDYKLKYYNFSDIVKNWRYKIIDNKVYGWRGKQKSFPSQIELDEDLYWLIGLYIAEGSCSKNSVYFSLNIKEIEIIEKIKQIVKKKFSLETRLRFLKQCPNCVNVCVSSTAFVHFMKSFVFGNSVQRTKQVNYNLLNKNYLKSLLEGIFAGDGYIDNRRKDLRHITTVVPHLAYFYFQLVASCGFHPSIKLFQNFGFQKNQKKLAIYHISWSVNRTKRNFEKLVDGKHFWAYKIKKIEKFYYKGQVYNLEIEDEPSYTTGLFLVHNCKSAYGIAFARSLEEDPKIENLPQILVYLACLGLKTCILPYGSRDESGFRAGFRITKQEIEAKGIYFIKIIKRWKILQMHLETNIIPERDFDLFSDWHCSYCPFLRPGEDQRGCYTQKEIDEYFEKKKFKK